VNKYDKIILSPGPGIPVEAGALLDVIKAYSSSKSIFGVCLGQQAMAEAFGGTLYNLPEPLHGVATEVRVNIQDKLFKDCPETFNAGRYHSWVIDRQNLPSCFNIIATDAAGEIMAIRHKVHDICGVQFHPESILTEHGKKMMQNWLES
ncbi:MAG: aminodeoxychorismate/anthranilate synthase component II, partial [Pedobacter sp.]